MEEQSLYFGEEGLSYLEDILKKENPHQVLLITGKKSFDLLPIKDDLLELFKGIELIHFNDNVIVYYYTTLWANLNKCSQI